ncbi:MAG TPA: helix-turn-helix domain-containing protein [Stellaceae bacterium]|jgi:transposase-like protein
MADETKRLFSRDYKLAALRRMLAGENVSALARELGVRRKYLYQWRERFRAGGPLALRSRGRPTKAEVLAMQAGEMAPDIPAASMPQAAPPDALTTAQRRIAELERKVGQQQVELDFFQRALRQVREVRQRSGAPGGTASTRSSKR